MEYMKNNTATLNRYADPIGPDAIDFDTFDFAAIKHLHIGYDHNDNEFYISHRELAFAHINYSMVLAWAAQHCIAAS